MLQSWMIVVMGMLQYNLAHTDKPIEYYIYKFKAEQTLYAKSCETDIPVRGVFDSLPGNIIGYCDVTAPVLTIRISKKYWKHASDLEREELVFHELGHCLLSRSHKEGDIQTGNLEMPTSVMKCCGMLGPFYKLFHKYYINELFNGE